MGNLLEQPVVTLSNDNEVLTIHNCINMKGKMVLTKAQASLIYIELHKFITNEEK